MSWIDDLIDEQTREARCLRWFRFYPRTLSTTTKQELTDAEQTLSGDRLLDFYGDILHLSWLECNYAYARARARLEKLRHPDVTAETTPELELTQTRKQFKEKYGIETLPDHVDGWWLLPGDAERATCLEWFRLYPTPLAEKTKRELAAVEQTLNREQLLDLYNDILRLSWLECNYTYAHEFACLSGERSLGADVDAFAGPELCQTKKDFRKKYGVEVINVFIEEWRQAGYTLI